MLGRVVLANVMAAALTVSALGTAMAQSPPSKRPRQLDRAERADALALVELVDAVAAGQLPGGDAWLTWKSHFFRGPDGNTYVPFSVTINEAADAFQTIAMYLRVVRRGEGPSRPAVQAPDDLFGELNAQFGGLLNAGDLHPATTGTVQDLRFIDSTRDARGTASVQGAVAVAPGLYDLYAAVRERPTAATTTPAGRPRSAVLKQQLAVPDFSRGLPLSSIMVIDRADALPAPLSAEEQVGRPYALGMTEFVPAADMKFTRGEALSLMFFVYNVRLDARGYPDVAIRYRVHQQVGGG